MDRTLHCCVQDDDTNSGNHIGLPLRGDDRFTACAKNELFTPGIKPRAFGYNFNVVVFFQMTSFSIPKRGLRLPPNGND